MWAAASPIRYVRPDFPTTMLLHGTADETVAVAERLRMHDALRKAARVELHTVEGAPHGNDQERDYGMVTAELVALFLDRHTKPALPISDAAEASWRLRGW